jgi:hypothetical protein
MQCVDERDVTTSMPLSPVRSSVLRVLICGMLLALAGCGDGGDDDSGTSIPSTGFVSITSTPDNPTYCSTALLSGEAFISKDYYRCCSGSATDTGVTVTWTNRTTGQSGAASQSVRICYFFGVPYLCDHTWSANVPVALGHNAITIRASDPGGAAGDAATSLERPEEGYTVSGTLRNDTGGILTSAREDTRLSLAGRVGRTATPGSDATYALSCVPSGSYQVTPSAWRFAYVFQPSFRDIVVAGQDVTGVDFTSPVSVASGSIVLGAGLSGLQGSMQISDGSNSASRLLSAAGPYAFELPDGVYTFTPFALSCFGCTWNPTSRTVVVSNANVPGLDFLLSQ